MDQVCFFCGTSPPACQISVPVGLGLAFRSACQHGGDSPDPAWRRSVLEQVMAAPTSRAALAIGSKTPATGVCAECHAVLEAPPPDATPLPAAKDPPPRRKSPGCGVLIAIALTVLVVAIGITRSMATTRHVSQKGALQPEAARGVAATSP